MTPEQMKPLGKECTAEQWLSLAQQAKDAGMVFLLLTGGEPLLRADFCELYGELSKMGLSIDINTNATLIDAKMAAFFSDNPPSKLNITLYGASRQTYQRLCGEAEAFDKVVNAIDMLCEAGLLVSLNATLTPENVCDTEQLAVFAKQRGLYLKMTSLVVPPFRRGRAEQPHRLSAEEAGRAAALGHLRYFGEETISRKVQTLQDTDLSVLDDCTLVGEAGTGCLAGNSQFWIAWNGEMYPCCMMPWISAEPFTAGFLSAWEQITDACAQIKQSLQCRSCSLSGQCPSCTAIRYCETNGDASARPEYLCRMTQAYCAELKNLIL